ncbi:uncharacterized protein MELLADRAFT_103334 [Melampsora larici-populina 98AG31]|uniref:Secreted protein n=1 Tax=Melampsora larici-populina (strain 98AG31 / pathotype 3-4-7) TaxID=747676 RepID=F4RA26_MELLP|nr:uncharacterized protein MELLADRAFT_103334 [Melampsora larici-populina 98AG31]EGG10641.1 secreted protein [Melampsora larici-populina 98AG31]
MNSFILIGALLQCLYVMATPQGYQHLEARQADALAPVTIGSVYRHATSPPNLMTCQSGLDKKVVNLQDCKKVATYMASHKLPCANYKSCALMTRASIGQPQAVQVTSSTELRYSFSMYFDESCQVTRQVKPRSKDFPETVDSNLYLTAGICAVGDPTCPTGEQVTTCSPEVSAFLKDLPLAA